MLPPSQSPVAEPVSVAKHTESSSPRVQPVNAASVVMTTLCPMPQLKTIFVPVDAVRSSTLNAPQPAAEPPPTTSEVVAAARAAGLVIRSVLCLVPSTPPEGGGDEDTAGAGPAHVALSLTGHCVPEVARRVTVCAGKLVGANRLAPEVTVFPHVPVLHL
eukprot:scaffold119284_cov53-Phaeocystis_antarctica.AAC.5